MVDEVGKEIYFPFMVNNLVTVTTFTVFICSFVLLYTCITYSICEREKVK